MSRYTIAVIAWFFFCFVLTTFILPFLGWSKNNIDLSQILLNFFLWGIVCFFVIYMEKRRLKKRNKNSHEKMD
jgi:membrane protease YdiL (CAAX protease family)